MFMFNPIFEIFKSRNDKIKTQLKKIKMEEKVLLESIKSDEDENVNQVKLIFNEKN